MGRLGSEVMEMRKVEYSRDNIEKCWCGHCPVQSGSECAKRLYEQSKASDELPPPEQLPGLYCSTGKATCGDIAPVNMCNCPACLVWGEHELTSNHYCVQGSAEAIGR